MGMGRVLASATLFVAGSPSAMGYFEPGSFAPVALPVSQPQDSAALENAARAGTLAKNVPAAMPVAWSPGLSRPSTASFAELSAQVDASSNGIARLADLAGGMPRTVVADVSPAVSPIPEPHIYGLLLAGVGAIGFVARRRGRGRSV